MPTTLRHLDITFRHLEHAHRVATTNAGAARFLGVSEIAYRQACDDYSLLTLDERQESLQRFTQGRRVARPKVTPPPMTLHEVQEAVGNHKSMLAASQASGVSYARLLYWAKVYGIHEPNRKIINRHGLGG